MALERRFSVLYLESYVEKTMPLVNLQKKFFITGFPRSRTKWFSEYFNGIPEVQCMHQGCNGCYSVESLLSKMERIECETVGDSDAILPFLELEGYPVIIIDRELEDVLESYNLMRLYVNDETLEILCVEEQLLKEVPGMHIKFNEIDKNIKEIHEYLIDAPFNEIYARKMCKKNIQVKTPIPLAINTYHRVIAPQLCYNT